MNVYITYSDSEFGSGRHVLDDGAWILHASSFHTSLWDAVFNDSKGNVPRAEEALSKAFDAAYDDIQKADVVYVYVGVTAMKLGMDLIERLLRHGKRVIMTGCTCFRDEKETFARQYALECIWTRVCGGSGLLTQIMQKVPA